MDGVLSFLDLVRAQTMRRTLAYRPARTIFLSRSKRLLLSFMASLLINFALALSFPFWVLALGPILFGMPHLFAGIRYISRLLNLKISVSSGLQLPPLLGFLFIGSGLLGLIFGKDYVSFHPHFLMPTYELGILLAALIVFGMIGSSRTRQIVFGSCLFLALLWASFVFPLYTLGLIAFAHNFVPFIYWYRAAESAADRKTIWISLSLLIASTILIWSPWGDSLMTSFDLSNVFHQPLLDPVVLSHQIFPAVDDPGWIGKILCSFALCQSMHYFIWLKAIPEQCLHRHTPLSFRESAKALKHQLGRPLTVLAVTLCVVFVGSLFVLPIPVIRDTYLCIASSHGYIELSAIPFLFAVRRS